MAPSAAPQTKTFEQIEYEQGFFLENYGPYGDAQYITLGLTEDKYAEEQRKLPLSEQGANRTKSAVG